MDSNSHERAVVTGASSGIGAVYADRLARRGHDLLLVARNREKLESISAQIASETGRCVESIVADLSTKEGCARVEHRLRGDETITMLVNDAGMYASGPIAEYDLDLHESMIAINVVALIRLTRAALPGFLARGLGTIVNLGSITSLMPEKFNGTYSATKAFVLNFTQTLHAEVSERGIRVQAVLPGGTLTDLWGRAGMDVSTFPKEVMMDVGEMVDAALAGLDQGEVVTIPSLPDARAWMAFEAARHALAPGLSLHHAADRYRAIGQTRA